MNDAASPTRDTLLVRRSEVSLTLGSNGMVVITVDGRDVEAGEHALLVLDAFSEPRSLAECVARLSVTGAQDFAALTRTILKLRQSGVLVEPGVDLAGAAGWDGPSIHTEMLSDEARTRSFLDAIAEVVRSGDVVVDIGTGTGILAIGAARAGASRVYAIEASGIAEIASRMFEENGVADRVTLVRGWSTRVGLPERARVMVSETVGNEAFGEGLIETVLDAKRRHLSPDAVFVPARVRIWGLACEMPDRMRRRHLFTRENTSAWTRDYGIGFEALSDAPKSTFALFLDTDGARALRPLAPPALLADVDLAAVSPTFETTTTFAFTEAGAFEAALVYFELVLSPSVTLDTHPARVGPRHSWRYPVWVSPAGRRVGPGDQASLAYGYKSGGGKVRIL
jgi:hypothetical protein